MRRMKLARARGGMVAWRVEARAQMTRFHETLRRLAMINEGFVEDQAGFGRGLAGISALDPKTPASLQVGVSAALGSSAVCLEWCAGRALAAGASEEEIADVLLAIAPVAGLGRVVAAAPEVATALGYGGMLLDVRPGRLSRRQQGAFCAAPTSMSR
jgi:alkylhydroperoxidase/carboxymuconolactone decarboxylase family protein YurZ